MIRAWLTLGLALAVGSTAAAGHAETNGDRLMTGASWEAFCERLKEVGKEILREDVPGSPLDRAEGYRYLLQRLAVSIDEVLDTADPKPLMTLYSHKLWKWGMDSADAKYTVARIRGDGSYRVYGTLGTAHHIAMQLITSRPKYAAFESLSLDELRGAEERKFEMIVSRERPQGWEGPWLRLDLRAHELLVREYFYDWDTEIPSRLMIDRLDDSGSTPPLGPVEMDGLLAEIGNAFAAYVPRWFTPSLQTRTDSVNRLQPPYKAPGEGIKDNAYGVGWFQLSPGEALLIELAEPDAHLWSFELGNFWWESLDYVNHTASLNGHQAARSSDGRYRLVIALEDPGVPNWLDSVGHPEGIIVYRYQLAGKTNPIPVAKLVKLSELQSLLPADTPRVTSEERSLEIRKRQAHAARRWAP
jgi:hypothetical protein